MAASIALPVKSPQVASYELKGSICIVASEIATSIEQSVNALRCLAKSAHFERKIPLRFNVDKKLLRCLPRPQSQHEAEHSSQHPNQTPSDSTITTSILSDPTSRSQSQSYLLALPYDILLSIFHYIQHAPSQISLALTCKQLSRLAQSLELCLSKTSAQYAGYLPKRCFDVPTLMKQLRSWMPDHLKLCNHCLTNRPRSEGYWRARAQILEAEEAVTVSSSAPAALGPGLPDNFYWIQKIGWVYRNGSWQRQVHDICPACWETCSLSDFVDCDGCRALGRLGDVDWSRVKEAGGNPSAWWARRTGVVEAQVQQCLLPVAA